MANLARQTSAEVLAALRAGDVALDQETSQSRTERLLRCIDDSHRQFALHLISSKAEYQTPDQEFTTQLAVLMYPLLDPASETYWQRILAGLEQQFRDEIPQALRGQVQRFAQRLDHPGFFPIQVNGELLDPQRVYLQLAKGFYFGRDPQAQKSLQDVLAAPFMAALFELVRALRGTAAFQALEREQATGPGQCIYCRTTEGPFTSEDHVLPEGLGNDALVLSKGTVCDPCNHGDLSGLDEALLNYAPIASLRTLYVPYTKGGKLPSADFRTSPSRRRRRPA